ncbi:MAG: transposase [Modestobacter sp.]|nr:transposase [Modestobacter sp.]
MGVGGVGLGGDHCRRPGERSSLSQPRYADGGQQRGETSGVPALTGPISTASGPAGRQRNLQATAETIQAALRDPQLKPTRAWSAATAAVRSPGTVIAELVTQTEVLRVEVEAGIGRHPDAEIYLSQPGIGPVLGARVSAEFGDDPHRYADPKARKKLLGHGPDHPRLGHQARGAGPLCPQPPPRDALYQQTVSARGANEPSATRTFDVLMLLLQTGACIRTEAEFAELFAAAGLRLAKIVPTASPNSILEGVTAYPMT